MSERLRLDVPKKKFRTGVGNASRVLDGVDGRSHYVRRFREIAAALSSDLSGRDNLCEAELQLVRSAAGLAVLRESLDVRPAKDGPESVKVPTYALITNTLRRVLVTIGLKRRLRE